MEKPEGIADSTKHRRTIASHTPGNTSKFRGIIPTELVEAVRADKCILFVGAGLSAQVNRSDGNALPGWSALLTEFLDWAITRQVRFWGDPEDIRAMIVKGNLLMAAQELQERVGAAGLGEFLDGVFRESAVAPSPIHRILPKIPFRAVLTTNYDSLIEGAYSLERNGALPPVWTQEDLSSRPSPLRGSAFFVFKIHGHLDRPNAVILGSRDYQDLLFRTPGYRQFLETLFATHVVLFVGFGGSDPNIDGVFDRLASIYSRTLDRHFILLPNHDGLNTTERRRLALDRRLEVIEYEKDVSHSQVGAFLRELAERVQKGPTSTAEDARRSTELTVFISHSVADADVVRKIASVLAERGFRPWVADVELLPGDDIGQMISEGLSASDAFIVLVSSSSLESRWVQLEIDSAVIREAEKKTLVIPILLDDAELPTYLQNRFYLRLKKPFAAEDLGPLVKSLERLDREKKKRA